MSHERHVLAQRQRWDGDQLVMVIVVFGLAWSCWTFMRPPAAVPQQVAAGDTDLLLLDSPRLQPGWVDHLEQPRTAAWWRSGGFEHRLTGRVVTPGKKLQVRPWLYTSSWLAEPVANVAEDGTFEAVVYFSPLYDGPMVLALELEDRQTKQVIGRVNYFFKPAAGGRR